MSLREEVVIEIDKIDELLESYRELFKKLETQRPNIIEITALASIIQSFYMRALFQMNYG